jgi:hypothetical protein
MCWLDALQDQLREFVRSCPLTPCHLTAALTLLEGCLADNALRPHWRWWAQPSQHPAAVLTWDAFWYRWVEWLQWLQWLQCWAR